MSAPVRRRLDVRWERQKFRRAEFAAVMGGVGSHEDEGVFLVTFEGGGHSRQTTHVPHSVAWRVEQVEGTIVEVIDGAKLAELQRGLVVEIYDLELPAFKVGLRKR